MKIKTSELTGAALNWAVAKCVHESLRHRYGSPCFNPKTKRVYETEGLQQIGVNFAPSTDWSQGGPIIEKERLHLLPLVNTLHADRQWECSSLVPDVGDSVWALGHTPLIAAMRCYVASKLGDTVDIPQELCK